MRHERQRRSRHHAAQSEDATAWRQAVDELAQQGSPIGATRLPSPYSRQPAQARRPAEPAGPLRWHIN